MEGETGGYFGNFPVCTFKKTGFIIGNYLKNDVRNDTDEEDTYPFSVVVLGKFRRFLLVIFLSLFLHLDFSFIYSKFSMPFWGFFY